VAEHGGGVGRRDADDGGVVGRWRWCQVRGWRLPRVAAAITKGTRRLEGGGVAVRQCDRRTEGGRIDGGR
jgi:hypothetical protein